MTLVEIQFEERRTQNVCNGHDARKRRGEYSSKEVSSLEPQAFCSFPGRLNASKNRHNDDT